MCLWLYAGLNYDACKRNHHRHHQMPESEADPDFCPTNNRSLLAWLVRFLRNYLNPAQLSRLILVLTVLLLAAQPHQSQPFDHSFCGFSASFADQHRTTFLCWHLPAPSQRTQTNRPRSFNQKLESSSVCITARLLPFWLPSRAPQPSQGSLVPAAGTTHWSIGALSSESEPVSLRSLPLTPQCLQPIGPLKKKRLPGRLLIWANSDPS